jgi:hypothetical protein
MPLFRRKRHTPFANVAEDMALPSGVQDGPVVGDAVRIIPNAETIERGWAGREGTFYGFTTPSVTGIAVIGLSGDLGFNVGFGDGVDEWFDPSLVERLGFDPAGTMSIGDRRFVRDAEGNWVPDSN